MESFGTGIAEGIKAGLGVPDYYDAVANRYVFQVSRDEWEDFAYAARCRKKRWHKDEERRQARIGGGSDKLNIPSEVYRVTRLISQQKGDNATAEWRTGGYWRTWWERVVSGDIFCEWKSWGNPRGGILIVGRSSE